MGITKKILLEEAEAEFSDQACERCGNYLQKGRDAKYCLECEDTLDQHLPNSSF